VSPTVTAIITVYNEKQLIARAVRSLLEQTLRDIEVLVIDDGSNDGTPEILVGIHDERLRILSLSRVGRAAALAKACEFARGRYIANLDADDVSYPRRLEQQCRFLDSHPDYAWVGCGEE